MHASPDTICAIATAHGRGGVGIVRVSGTRAGLIAQQILGRIPTPRCVTRSTFTDTDGTAIDDGIGVWFAGPASFTGEDVLELHGHGGPVVLDLLLARTVGLGARVARPGEFSERAFLNGKLDLSQAEAIADLIDASTAAAARGAARTLRGDFSLRIRELVDGLIRLRSFVEGSLDFPDEEDVGAISAPHLCSELQTLLDQHQSVLRSAQQGAVLREGFSVAILGQPNVGKSSLLNCLVGADSAIVTDIPGTTRDTVREVLNIGGVPVTVVDTAGLRTTPDPVEAIGMERSVDAGASADLVLWVVDDSVSTPPVAPDVLAPGIAHWPPVLWVHNKIDVSGRRASIAVDTPSLAGESAGTESGKNGLRDATPVFVSAVTGAGIDALKTFILRLAGLADPVEGLFLARRRHLEALAQAGVALRRAIETTRESSAIELAADDMRIAQRALSEITGEFTSDDLLGEIFASFCIGK